MVYQKCWQKGSYENVVDTYENEEDECTSDG